VCSREKLQIAIEIEIEILRAILGEILRMILRERARERVEFDDKFCLELERIFLGLVNFYLGVLGACKEDSRSCKDLVEFVCVCVQEFCVVFFFLAVRY